MNIRLGFNAILKLATIILSMTCCSKEIVTPVESIMNFGPFSNETEVEILGYSGSAMEPFISRDGQLLFFNNSGSTGEDMNIHYSRKISDVQFDYLGELPGANTKELEGVPTMDTQGNFYFTTMRSYRQDLLSIYQGSFNGEEINHVTPTDKSITEHTLGLINFDSEVSADGLYLYYAGGRFAGESYPREADLSIAEKIDGQFLRMPNSDELLDNINTDLLEYAPSISTDGLELFFTRTDINVMPPKMGIWKTRRSNRDLPFEKPTKIEAIQGVLIEGPSITDDGMTLYYHKNIGGNFKLFKVTRTRL